MNDFSKAQADNMKNFIRAQDKQTYLREVQLKLDSINQVYDVTLGGKKLLETDIYKSHAPIFKQIYQKLLAKSLVTAATNAISKFSQPTGDLQANLNSVIGGLLSLGSQTTPEDQSKLAAELFLPNEDIDKVLKGLRDYEAESNDTYSNKNEVLRKKRAVELYKDAYELYWKVIRNIYWRETGFSRRAVERGHKNDDVLKYFATNYPLLSKSVNNLLKNDASHLNYTEREKYTSDELMASANEVLTGLITAVVVQFQLYKDIFESAAPSVGQFLSGNSNSGV